jgi:hypothetical protein
MPETKSLTNAPYARVYSRACFFRLDHRNGSPGSSDGWGSRTVYSHRAGQHAVPSGGHNWLIPGMLTYVSVFGQLEMVCILPDDVHQDATFRSDKVRNSLRLRKRFDFQGTLLRLCRGHRSIRHFANVGREQGLEY